MSIESCMVVSLGIEVNLQKRVCGWLQSQNSHSFATSLSHFSPSEVTMNLTPFVLRILAFSMSFMSSSVVRPRIPNFSVMNARTFSIAAPRTSMSHFDKTIMRKRRKVAPLIAFGSGGRFDMAIPQLLPSSLACRRKRVESFSRREREEQRPLEALAVF